MTRKVILIAALVCGIAAALLSKIYIGAKERTIANELARIKDRYGEIEVVCFKVDVPAGTELRRKDLGLVVVPAMGLRGQALTEEDVNSVIGRKTTLGHSRGDVLFWSDVDGGDLRDKSLSGDIKRQMRAVSIDCQGSAAVSGMVCANDHVDVIGTFVFPGADGTTRSGTVVTCTILQNVLVLAKGQSTSKSESFSYAGDQTVTLEVTPREAEMLAFAQQMKGRLVLTLRNRNDSSFERELPQVDYERIKREIESLNLVRQQKVGH